MRRTRTGKPHHVDQWTSNEHVEDKFLLDGSERGTGEAPVQPAVPNGLHNPDRQTTRSHAPCKSTNAAVCAVG